MTGSPTSDSRGPGRVLRFVGLLTAAVLLPILLFVALLIFRPRAADVVAGWVVQAWQAPRNRALYRELRPELERIASSARACVPITQTCVCAAPRSARLPYCAYEEGLLAVWGEPVPDADDMISLPQNVDAFFLALEGPPVAERSRYLPTGAGDAWMVEARAGGWAQGKVQVD